MHVKRFLITVGAVFAFSLAWNSVVHGVVLADANAQLAQLRRPEPDLALGIALTLAIAVLFVGSYAALASTGGVGAGVRHGLWFALLAGVFVDANQYLLYPIPLQLALSWFGFGVAEFSLSGALMGWLYPISGRNGGNDAWKRP